MKLMNVLIASVLAVTFLASCTTVEYVPASNDCTPPERPVLPSVDRGELWDTFVSSEAYRIAQEQATLDLSASQEDKAMATGDDKYRVLERYINTLYGFSDEQHVMLTELCEAP